MTPEILRDLVIDALNDRKGQDILALGVSEATSFTDYMVIATGTSGRHVKSLVDLSVERAKSAGCVPFGVEGEKNLEWVLIDLGDVVVHVMQAEARDFYDLERLWTSPTVGARSALQPSG